MTRDLIQIIPRLDRQMEGVAGYATALAASFVPVGWQTTFVLPAGTGGDLSSQENFEARTVRSSPEDVTALLARADRPVVLHYVNYGYEPRGCPAWLVEGVRRWRTATTVPLITIFHEIYATGAPWRSSFWLSPRQRHLAKTLARASEVCVTSLSLYAGILRRWLAPERVIELPVFSAVGEPATVSPLAKRAARMAIFGSPGVRRRAFVEHADRLRRVCEALSLTEIVDIGAPTASDLGGGIRVRSLGWLEPSQVSELLADSRAGFLCYPPGFLGKSTVFAAYCSHGLLPLWSQSRPGRLRSEENVPAWDVRGQASWASMDELQTVADAARAWYQEHSLRRQTSLIVELLSGGRASS